MSLCTPAFIYILLSSIGIIILAYQNYGNQNLYCVGNVNCPVESTTPVFIAKILYVLFWTFILNTLCSYGYYKLSWFILLLPFILFFVIVTVWGQVVNRRTIDMRGSGVNYMGQGQQQAAAQQSQQSQQFYTYQQQAAAQQQQQQPQQQQQQPQQQQQQPQQQQQQPQMQKQQKDNVAPPSSEQTHWFQGNQNNAGNNTSNYSSYADYNKALDSRPKQIYNESHERGQQSQYHY
jgi:K+-sensing histidine kinase KdpD